MEPKKIAALAGAGVLLLIATLIVWDFLVVTDEERIESFADAVTEEVNPENIEAALAYVDPSVQPVLIEVRGQSIRFDKENKDDFAGMARARLLPFHGISQAVMRKTIEVHDTRASISTQTLSRRGRLEVDWELRKHGDGWLVSRMTLR